MNRRDLLTGMGGLAAIGIGARQVRDWNERSLRARVFIARASSYQADLESIIDDGLRALGLSAVMGERTVGPLEAQPGRALSRCAPGQHPSACRARGRPGISPMGRTRSSWSPKDRAIAAMPSSCSTSLAWGPSLDDARLEFVDLNHDDVWFVPNRFGATALRELALPATLDRADLIVSLPKLKTHHWAGVTLSLKNFFGVMPGIVYGWPKNVLHHAGIGPVDPRHRRGGPSPSGDRRRDHRHGRGRTDHGDAAAVEPARDGNESAGRRCHVRAADGNQSLADWLPRRGVGPARSDLGVAHRAARRVDQGHETEVSVAGQAVISRAAALRTKP